jgi:pimeloyl-ACP methyl ester carboxylesterase
MNDNNIFILSDGKKLCYAEYGNPDGIPVMLLHGNPGARISWGLYPESPYLKNIRIIAPDRPGYGRTDYKKNALKKWPGDISELCEYLEIKKFHLFAPSGGGPYALACAWKLPEWMRKTILWSAGTFTSSKKHGPLEFFFTVLAMNMVSPTYGTHTLKAYFE